MRIDVNPSINVNVTVQFEDPHWVARVERSDAHGPAVARVEFDHEPAEAEVRDYVTQHYETLQFSAAQNPALKGHEALKHLLEQRQHQNAINARLNHQGGKQKFSVKGGRQKDRHRGVR